MSKTVSLMCAVISGCFLVLVLLMYCTRIFKVLFIQIWFGLSFSLFPLTLFLGLSFPPLFQLCPLSPFFLSHSSSSTMVPYLDFQFIPTLDSPLFVYLQTLKVKILIKRRHDFCLSQVNLTEENPFCSHLFSIFHYFHYPFMS